MKEQLEARLQDLKGEFEEGRKMLAELEEQRKNLKETLLRITGAVQVLEEELGRASDSTVQDSGPDERLDHKSGSATDLGTLGPDPPVPAVADSEVVA